MNAIDPYADCRLAVNAVEENIRVCIDHGLVDAWEATRQAKVSPESAVESLIRNARYMYVPADSPEGTLAEIKRQMALPSFLAYVRAKLGAM